MDKVITCDCYCGDRLNGAPKQYIHGRLAVFRPVPCGDYKGLKAQYMSYVIYRVIQYVK